MNDFAHDPLAQRLRRLKITTPDASLVGAAALSAHRPLTGPSRRTLMIALTLVPLITLLTTAIVAYFAPAFSQALADSPIAGRVAGPVLRQFGLASIEDRVSSFGDRWTSNGYTIELVGGYADSSRTVLFLRVTPAARVVMMSPDHAQLYDQFGLQYQQSSGFADSETGDAAITFAPIESPARSVGARLTLTLTQLEDRTASQPVPIAGRWALHGTLLPDEGRDLTLPEQGALGSATFMFTKARALPAALLVEAQITGATVTELVERIPDGLKGRPVFTVRLFDPAGHERPFLSGGGGSGGNASSFRQQWLWEITGPGRYELVLAWEGRGTLTRTLVMQ
ncbi:MAG: hypothetical protein ACRDF9_14955 [Candidatus Limnocylindria bacterium]